VAHCEVSAETWAWSFASVLEGWRRAIAWTADTEGSERSIERILEPWHG